MKNFSLEMIQQAKQTKNADELFALAQKNNVEMTKEEAQEYYEQFNPSAGEVSDDELGAVSGGGCGDAVSETFKLYDKVKIRDGLSYKCKVCESKTGTYIPYNNGTWGVMCDKCNDGTLIVRADNSNNPAGTITKI